MILSFKDACGESREIVGGKGKGLCDMVHLGLPVPPFVIIPTNASEYDLSHAIKYLEDETGRVFGDPGNPLVLSVRSGAPVSMPGIMDTVTNVGLSDEIIAALPDRNFANDLAARPRTMDIESAVRSVKDSFYSERACEYRHICGLSDGIGTAVIIQAMVFGNRDDKSMTGVVFSRNPSTGEKGLWGEYIEGAQGDDIVSGARTPSRISSSIEIYDELEKYAKVLEEYYKDMQDIEFTVESGKLWLLQTRSGMRSPAAAVKIAVSMVHENIISKKDAVKRIDASVIEKLMHPAIESLDGLLLVANGMPSSPGAACGKLFTGDPVPDGIMAKSETCPDDIIDMSKSAGLITIHGGMTSHAAVVARAMAKPCVTGISEMSVHVDHIKFGDTVALCGDDITIDGSSGKVFKGRATLIDSCYSAELFELLAFAKEHSRVKVYANADTVEDVEKAAEFGADGIGLCRSEHMFFEKERAKAIQRYILHRDNIEEIYKFQENDFYDLFLSSDGFPVTIRLLDPPLHEFLPNDVVHEFNPMLGNRGCRLAFTAPELYLTQARAIFDARNRLGTTSDVRILIPFISFEEEMTYIKNMIKPYSGGCLIGAMIETPRAALLSGKIARHVDFISFGTNDLTQMTLGISRDDSASFMQQYIDNEIVGQDPFVELDEVVQNLMLSCVTDARAANPAIRISICGEHAGNPAHAAFFNELQLDYISCSAYRIAGIRVALCNDATMSI